MSSPDAASLLPEAALASQLLASEYGLEGEVSPLSGHNSNFLITVADGRRFVLKLAGENATRDVLDLERQASETCRSAEKRLEFPQTIETSRGENEACFRTREGQVLRGRLFNFMPGASWWQQMPPSMGRFRDLGRCLGKLGLALSTLEHPAARRTHRWDLTAAAQHRSKVAFVKDPWRRRILEWAFHLYSACALPRLAGLPRALIHGDVNDENLLVANERILGLLDFGDCLHNPRVCELAIALAYAMLDVTDPLRCGAETVAAYHEELPLSKDELSVLFPLICGRLAVSIAVSTERRRIDPDHPNWFVTEERAWHLLERFFPFDPAAAARILACGAGVDPHPQSGLPAEQLLEKRSRLIGRSLSIAYREPIKMVRGSGQYLYDDRGRPFLDLVNNVCHVGHCHPRVVEAGQRQMERLNTNTRYLYDNLTEYAERLCATLPETLDTCYFVNSGSEANELARRLAMAHTGRSGFLVVDGAYHGHTAALISMSPYKYMGAGGEGRPGPGVYVVPLADGYRGEHKGQGRSAGKAYGDDVGRVIEKADVAIAGILIESLLSCGGQVIPPKGYLETAFGHVREAGGLCIADEVQVGFGRVGTHFWAFEMQDVVPDIVVMGKPIGNGHPMSAVITTSEIAQSFANGMEFFATFGGNPVSCAIGLAVLDVIRDEGLQEHALQVGTRLRDGLRELMPRHDLIGEVRGAGLFIGVELVRDRSTLEPASQEAAELVERMKARGMLLSTDGPLANVIKMKPPMVLSADDVDMVVRSFDDEISSLGAR